MNRKKSGENCLLSEIIKMTKDKCINELITLFNRSDDISIIKTTESGIEFQKGLVANRYKYNITYRGIILFIENEGTNVSIEYKRGILYSFLIFSFFIILFNIAFLIYILSNIKPNLSVLFLQIALFFIIILPFSRYWYNLNKDEEEFANVVFNFLYSVSQIYEVTLTPPKISSCPICGYQNKIDAKKCKKCSTEFSKCTICKKIIPVVDVVFCPYCKAPFHKDEILEWLKVKASCPNCEKEIDMWEYQNYLNMYEKIEEISSKLLRKIQETSSNACRNCKKNIPIDSNFCIFCGYKLKK